ncbi:signal peptide peptidase SppA [Flavisolibacter ginsenosidimutans]|uniref:Signal peptide peptidase SppA n=1 Tax=Flavisolibacter ginsenosidimutans TaxID=661481 RepID=A0A5B8UPZ0_9BACT|nr:signal peptide peptidase SppA [Flavisolibacter ginsenosidimutans]QEC58309.1 signal peptide peptidase SppA [Flavisolibacter ginsenosidimutans]
MRSFFKIFFASLLALTVFSLIVFFVLVGLVKGFAEKSKPNVEDKSVLVIDLSKHFPEHESSLPLAVLGEERLPALFDVVRLIREAKTDKNIRGIYLSVDGNGNGYASSDEIRTALLDFKASKKFVIAFGNTVSQQAYFVASAANKIYINPTGGMDWTGFSVELPFLKGTLEKLDIQPQIFYAGKFKSATEIFRTEKMTPENRLQTTEWLGDLYNYFLQQTAVARKLDTATLYRLAAEAKIQTPQDALAANLIDGTKYDDEVKDEIKKDLAIGRADKLNLLSINDYNDAVNVRKSGKDKIAVIYAEGDIVDGDGSNTQIGGETFRALIRKARLDENVKAIVLRVNSGGGSALASDVIWREIQVARQQDKKPVIVSMGDVAASGGYYISCGADSVFAHPNTITGSIGVFSIIPNMQGFFKNKLGITFDGVSTAPHAGAVNVYRPIDEKDKALLTASVERIYAQFKSRVAAGRKRDTAYIESIAQGRVWSGEDAVRIGLVDRLGNLQDAIDCAARMAKLSDYGLREYPETESWLNNLLNKKKQEPAAMMKEEIGEENYRIVEQLKKIKAMTGSVQARLPFEIIIK